MDDDYADLRPEPVDYVPFGSGRPEGRLRAHPLHPLSLASKQRRLAEIVRVIDGLEAENAIQIVLGGQQ